jgi:hypothetical protein
MYSLAVYDFKLSAEQVKQNFDAKLPDSPPVVVASFGTVDENMAHGAKNSSGSIATWILLSAVDQDEDESYPNFVAEDRVSKPMKVFLSSLPEQTILLDFFSGSEISATPAEVPPVFEDITTGELFSSAEAALLPSDVSLVKTYRVRVRPPTNVASRMVSECEIHIDNTSVCACERGPEILLHMMKHSHDALVFV